MGNIEGKMEKSLMERWTEIEKINEGRFLLDEDVIYTANFLSVLRVQVCMVEGLIPSGVK